MNSHHVRPSALVVLLLLTATASSVGHAGEIRTPSRVASTTTLSVYRPFLINRLFNYYSNNGDGSYNPFSPNNEGVEFPKGDGKTTVFEDGIVWGVKQRDSLKVGGSVYRHGVQAGPIITNGTAPAWAVPDDPDLPAHRVYRVRRDMRPIPGVSDPGDARAATELGILQNEEVALISRYQATTASELLQRYWDDWNGWPATLGAPYTDVDHNGVYDPSVDIPGPPMADQTLWYVANDMKALLTQNLSGSDPIGLEMQRTIWGYRSAGALGNVIFMSSRLINKSGVALDSVHIVQWADPDLGDAGDDLVGCDTTLGLGYAYNGRASDFYYGSTPPAVGFVLLQGPSVAGSSADTAMWGFTRHAGYRNLPMSAFTFFSGGSPAYADPAQGVNGNVQWWQIMHARSSVSGVPFVDPGTGDTVRFVFPGDPVTGTGWVDGKEFMPGDRRLCMTMGPFTMAPGDTQEIAVACCVARSSDRFASITALKKVASAVRDAYVRLPAGLIVPRVTAAYASNGGQVALSFRADARGIPVSGIEVQLRTYDEALVSTVALADDGAHQDGAAGDSIYGGAVQLAPLAHGLFADAVVTDAGGHVNTWGHILDNITTVDLTVPSFSIGSDNINSDGIPNPGENVRYTIALRNGSPVGLTHLAVSAWPNPEGHQILLGALGGDSTHAWTYDPNDPLSYFSFDVPPWYTDSTFSVAFTISDSSDNIWWDTLTFPVRPFPSRLYTTPLQHVAGNAAGSFEIQIVDSSKVKNHLYLIRGAALPGLVGGYAVKDSTTGTVLLADHPLPDALGHTSPVIDGFKVLLGSVNNRPGMRSWEIPSGSRRFSPVGGWAGLGLEGFSNAGYPDVYDQTQGTIGMAGHLALGGIGTTLEVGDYHDVLLKLADVPTTDLWDPKTLPADTNFSRAYRYVRSASSPAATPSFAPWIVNKVSGYPYQGYDYSVPFAAWDMETDPPTRLAVGLMENNASAGLVDGRYWPGITTVDNSAAREIGFIFKAPYTETPDPALAVNMSNNHTTPLMWVMTCARRSDAPWFSGDQFKINAFHMLTAADVWTFRPTIVTATPATGEPATFALLQNYPNPFNPTTRIRFSLATAARTKLTVYDLLGREVAVLVDDLRAAGAHEVTFDARGLASGVYFYRLQAGGLMHVQKMMVVR